MYYLFCIQVLSLPLKASRHQALLGRPMCWKPSNIRPYILFFLSFFAVVWYPYNFHYKALDRLVIDIQDIAIHPSIILDLGCHIELQQESTLYQLFYNSPNAILPIQDSLYIRGCYIIDNSGSSLGVFQAEQEYMLYYLVAPSIGVFQEYVQDPNYYQPSIKA